jgi:hypothetical protein
MTRGKGQVEPGRVATCGCELCERLAEAERARGYPGIAISGRPRLMTRIPGPSHPARVFAKLGGGVG